MKKINWKFRLFFFCLAFQLGINSGCQEYHKKKITQNELYVIESSCPKQVNPVNLYYLDGDCSLCLAKAKDFDENKFGNGGKTLILFKVSNPVLANMYIQAISLRSCVILDSTNLFAKSFVFDHVYEISKNGEILSEKADK
nr:hypothetical protein [uncultured Sediminibacterium sp.]